MEFAFVCIHCSVVETFIHHYSILFEGIVLIDFSVENILIDATLIVTKLVSTLSSTFNSILLQ